MYRLALLNSCNNAMPGCIAHMGSLIIQYQMKTETQGGGSVMDIGGCLLVMIMFVVDEFSKMDRLVACLKRCVRCVGWG